MSLRINTNVPAMTALMNVGQTQDGMALSIERLSTGMRINRASDDPSGLIKSESLRASISGLQTAVRNSQDTVNLAKTAEGGLAEISRLLDSIKSLAVSAANTGVVDTNQAAGYQTEISSLLSSIDRITDTTLWGGRQLLNGASGTSVSVTAIDSVSSLTIGSKFGGDQVKSGSVSIQPVTAATQSTTGALATTFAASNNPVSPGVFSINGTTFKVDAGDTVDDVVTKINLSASSTHVTASFTPGQGISLTSSKYGSRYPVNYVESTPILNGGSSATGTPGVDAVFDVTMPTSSKAGTTTVRFTGGTGTTDDGLTLTSPDGDKLALNPAANSLTGSTMIGAVSVGEMQFQIGAGAGDAVQFGIPSVRSSALGLNTVSGKSLASIDVTTATGAQEALKIVDASVNQVSDVRAKLGSFQRNIVETNMRSLDVAKENLTAADSTIRDVDVAAEMTNFTKMQILQQSGVSVLAQANRLPQSVLELIKG